MLRFAKAFKICILFMLILLMLKIIWLWSNEKGCTILSDSIKHVTLLSHDFGPKASAVECRINHEISRNIDKLRLKKKNIKRNFYLERCFKITQNNSDEIFEGLNEVNEDVYVPFTFVKKYFDVYGNVVYESDGTSWLAWSHSNTKGIVEPTLKNGFYDSTGPFVTLETANVEQRSRVLLISAGDGVPMSSQWGNRNGFYYPIQIAQFALSHWSKFKLFNETAYQIILKKRIKMQTKNDSTPVTITNGLMCNISNNRLPQTSTSDESVPFSMATYGWKINEIVLCIDLQILEPMTAEVYLEINLKFGSKSKSFSTVNGVTQINQVNIRYTTKSSYKRMIAVGRIYLSVRITLKNQMNITYLRDDNDSTYHWRLTRILLDDVLKALSLYNSDNPTRPIKLNTDDLHIQSIHTGNTVCFSDFSLTVLHKYHHLRLFDHAVGWFMRNQDVKGGWPINVTLKSEKYSRADNKLFPGWYNAMAQGHGISVLTRAFSYYQDLNYLRAAGHATELFHVPSTKGGVLAQFMGQHLWYEEYPIRLGSYTLNGFMYSLLGLYELKNAFSGLTSSQRVDKLSRWINQTELLYKQGINSLVVLLPMFDAGSRTYYDLRHITLRIPPIVARWGYHKVHVVQLMAISSFKSMDNELKTFLKTTADRWLNYMQGFRVKHN